MVMTMLSTPTTASIGAGPTIWNCSVYSAPRGTFDGICNDCAVQPVVEPNAIAPTGYATFDASINVTCKDSPLPEVVTRESKFTSAASSGRKNRLCVADDADAGPSLRYQLPDS